MSTKFLPFITDMSTEEATFKAIIKRTKGSSYSTILNLFSIVVNIGIELVRVKIDSYPDNLTTANKIQELINENSTSYITKKEQEFWSFVLKMSPNSKQQKSSDYSDIEKLIFFTAVVKFKPENLETYGYFIDIQKCTEYSKEDFNIDLNNIKNSSIQEKESTRLGFTCWEELKAYVSLNEKLSTKKTFVPVYINLNITNVTQLHYENSHCKSPYLQE